MFEQEKVTSVMNEAGLQLQRLHNIWIMSRVARESGNLLKLRWHLDSAEVELSEDVDLLDESLKGDETYSKRFDSLNGDVGKNLKNKVKLYGILMRKEKLLRKVQNAVGKGGKFRDWDEDEMD